MMVNKAKKQGTNYETNIVNRLNKVNNFKAQRFAEGGSNDLGDIQLFIGDEEFFIEAKSRQNLNLHQTCLLYTSPSPRDLSTSRMPSSA